MPYEHQQEANQVAGNLLDIMNLLTDDVPDQQQIAQLLAESTGIFAQVTATLSTEEKKAYKAKFLAKIGINLASRSLDKFLPDSES